MEREFYHLPVMQAWEKTQYDFFPLQNEDDYLLKGY